MLKSTDGHIQSTSMSIDRINPALSYVLSNIRLVCHAINCFKGTMTDAEMVTFARAVVDGAL
jgi:hypothetical protein